MKTVLIHSLVSAALASAAALVYNQVYQNAFLLDYSTVITTGGIVGSCVFGCALASVGYWLAVRYLKTGADVAFNALFTALTFASLAGPFAMQLPLELDAPELFVGLTAPMHFIP